MDCFAALADPTRRRLIEALAGGERKFGDLASRFEMIRPAVSQHLKVLREAGIVAVRREAQRRVYRLDEQAFRDVEGWLSRVRQSWNPRLDRLEQVLAEEEENDDD